MLWKEEINGDDDDAFLIISNYYRNHNAKFEINKTILTYLK